MINNRSDAWAIVRADGPAAQLTDYIAVKAVYDNAEEAKRDLARLTDCASNASHYRLIKTRRRPASTQDQELDRAEESRVQGLVRPSNARVATSGETSHLRRVLDELLATLPPDLRRATVTPILGRVAEDAVASALSVQSVATNRQPWDLELSDGKRVEVKSVLLDPGARKAPLFQIREPSSFDLLALVIFWPDLTLQTAKLFPVDALVRYGRPEVRGSQYGLNVRVTPALLGAPEAQEIFPPGDDIWARTPRKAA